MSGTRGPGSSSSTVTFCPSAAAGRARLDRQHLPLVGYPHAPDLRVGVSYAFLSPCRSFRFRKPRASFLVIELTRASSFSTRSFSRTWIAAMRPLGRTRPNLAGPCLNPAWSGGGPSDSACAYRRLRSALLIKEITKRIAAQRRAAHRCHKDYRNQKFRDSSTVGDAHGLPFPPVRGQCSPVLVQGWAFHPRQCDRLRSG